MNVNELIVGAGLINAILILALVLMVRDWPRKKLSTKKR